jgi:hypothetical protein
MNIVEYLIQGVYLMELIMNVSLVKANFKTLYIT